MLMTYLHSSVTSVAGVAINLPSQVVKLSQSQRCKSATTTTSFISCTSTVSALIYRLLSPRLVQSAANNPNVQAIPDIHYHQVLNLSTIVDEDNVVRCPPLYRCEKYEMCLTLNQSGSVVEDLSLAQPATLDLTLELGGAMSRHIIGLCVRLDAS